jgi:hypothetical protein
MHLKRQVLSTMTGVEIKLLKIIVKWELEPIKFNMPLEFYFLK